MIYRFALAFGLLLLGTHLGREISRTKPARAKPKRPAYPLRSQRLTAAPVGKVSLH